MIGLITPMMVLTIDYISWKAASVCCVMPKTFANAVYSIDKRRLMGWCPPL